MFLMCDNHRPVPCRELEFEIVEDAAPWMVGHIVRTNSPYGDHHQIIATRTDGLGCPACGSFEPSEKPDGDVR